MPRHYIAPRAPLQCSCHYYNHHLMDISARRQLFELLPPYTLRFGRLLSPALATFLVVFEVQLPSPKLRLSVSRHMGLPGSNLGAPSSYTSPYIIMENAVRSFWTALPNNGVPRRPSIPVEYWISPEISNSVLENLLHQLYLA